jgi:hypothetical protein
MKEFDTSYLDSWDQLPHRRVDEALPANVKTFHAAEFLEVG